MSLVLDDPAALSQAADGLRRQAAVYEDVGTLLRGLHTDDWTGLAAENFRSLFAAEPGRWFDAADVVLDAAGALDVHADVARWARGRLTEARDLHERAALVTSPDAAVRMAQEADAIASDALLAYDDSSWLTSARLDAVADAAPQTARWQGAPWWDVAWRAVANAGVDVVNALVSTGTAIQHHPGDAGMLIAGVAMIDGGASLAIASLAADATGVGLLVGVPAGVAGVGVAVAGAVTTRAAVSDLWMHATGDDARTPLDKMPEGETVTAVSKKGYPRSGVADPAPPNGAGPGWIKFRADNQNGWVWQSPESFPTGRDIDQFRIMEPTDTYRRGYVRFTNSGGQSLDVFGKPKGHAETHLELTDEGAYPTPEGWPY